MSHSTKSLMDTFPASDPLTPETTSGPKAVPFEEVSRAVPEHFVRVVSLFDERSDAKIAYERLLREVSVDPQHVSLEDNPDDDTVLYVSLDRADVEALEALIKKSGGFVASVSA